MPTARVRLLSVTIALATILPCQSGDPSRAAPPTTTPPTVDRLLVCNKADHSLSLFDPVARREIAVLPTGKGPHEVAVAPDGRIAVVSDYGAQQPGTTLTVIDLVRGEVQRTIELTRTETADDGTTQQKVCPRPHGLQFVDQDHVVVTSESARRLVLLDLPNGRIARTWPTPQVAMHMVALSPDRRHANATSVTDGNLAVFALEGGTDGKPLVVPCGTGAEGLAVDPTTGEVWVANRAANTLSVFDPKSGKVADPLATGDLPFRIVFTPDGKWALVACAESGDVQVWDSRRKTLVRSISIHSDGSELSALPMGLCTDPAGKLAFVACGRGEFVAVLDVTAGAVVDRMQARRGPDGIAYARVPLAPGEAPVTR